MSGNTTIAAPAGRPVDLSREAAVGVWEFALAAAIAIAALVYLLRSWGLIGRRKQPGCATCSSGCGGCSGSAASDGKAGVVNEIGRIPDSTGARQGES